jgi:hypothetical protein
MISRIGPLVQVGAKTKTLALHLAGGAVGGTVAGVFIGFLGTVVAYATGGASQDALKILVPAALVYLGAIDLGVRRLPAVFTSRQTPSYWSCAFGESSASFMWGVDLGLLVTTRIPYQVALVLPLAALLCGNVAVAVVLMGAYGFVKAAVVVLAIVRADGRFAQTCDVIARRTDHLGRALSVAAVGLAVALAITTLPLGGAWA